MTRRMAGGLWVVAGVALLMASAGGALRTGDVSLAGTGLAAMLLALALARWFDWRARLRRRMRDDASAIVREDILREDEEGAQHDQQPTLSGGSSASVRTRRAA